MSGSTDTFLPYGSHYIDEDDIEAVVEVLKSGPLTCGPKVDEFEAAFARKIGVSDAIVCANGTAALHLASLAAGLKEGDIAIVPAITFLATANAVRMTGAEVCFADVDPATGLMSPETLVEAFERSGKQAKAVLPVHMNGQSEHMQDIAAFASDRGMAVISDCCHALGAEYVSSGKPGDGQFEAFGTFSLHPVKSIAMGEGGVVTTNNSAKAHLLRQLRGHAMEKDPGQWLDTQAGTASDGKPNPWYYEMQKLAYNYRATDIQCALGISQLKKLDVFVEKRRNLAAHYDRQLTHLDNRVRSVRRSSDCVSAWHLYPVLIDFSNCEVDRAGLMEALHASGIGTQVHYVPVSRQPYYVERYGRQNLPGAENYYSQVLSLPIFPAMEQGDVDRVVNALAKVLDG